jgi:hypothetical protein
MPVSRRFSTICFCLLLCGFLLTPTLVFARGKAVRAGGLLFSFDSIYGANARQRQVKRYYFYNRRCKVVGLYGLTRETFSKSVRHLKRVLSDRYFRKLLLGKRRWFQTNHTSRQILQKLLKEKNKVIVNSFRRDKGFPCKTNKADGHVNGFAQRGVRILFLYKPYIREQGELGEWGIRNLARTVLHETMHTLGYSHAALKVGSVAYNNSVPVYLGCLANYWPRRLSRRKVQKLRRFCSLSSLRKNRQLSSLSWWRRFLKKSR